MIENPIPWPDGARCAVAFTFDMDAESLLHIYTSQTARNRVALRSLLRYGPEVAMPRIVDLFKRYDLRQTFFVPGWCIERYPRAVQLIMENGHEIGHHGYIHEKPNQLGPDEELSYLKRAIDTIVNATGERPQGYRAPSYAFSQYTLDYLLDEGFQYDASLLGHDIPYIISNQRGYLIELASDITMDDWTHYVCLKDFGNTMPVLAPERTMEVFRAEFDAAWRHGGMWIGVWHPFVSGRLSRCDAIAGLIDYMNDKGNVWFARLDEIADHANRCLEDGTWSPRVESVVDDAPSPCVPRQDGVLAP